MTNKYNKSVINSYVEQFKGEPCCIVHYPHRLITLCDLFWGEGICMDFDYKTVFMALLSCSVWCHWPLHWSSAVATCLMNSPWRCLDITDVSVPEIIICKLQNCILDGNSKFISKLLINGYTISTNMFTLNTKIPQLLESCCLLCCNVCTVHVAPWSP